MPSLAELRSLEAQATPSPWHTYDDESLPRADNGDLLWPGHLGERLPSYWDYHLRPEDVRLLVIMRNTLPFMLMVIEAARALIDAWDEESRLRARAGLNSALHELEAS